MRREALVPGLSAMLPRGRCWKLGCTCTRLRQLEGSCLTSPSTHRTCDTRFCSGPCSSLSVGPLEAARTDGSRLSRACTAELTHTEGMWSKLRDAGESPSTHLGVKQLENLIVSHRSQRVHSKWRQTGLRSPYTKLPGIQTL